MRVFLAALFSLFISVDLTQAQVISPSLQSTLESAGSTDKIAVIIELADRPDVRPFLSRVKKMRQMSPRDKGQHRRQLLRSLKSRADFSQRELRRALRRHGASSLKSLWINNSIAAELSGAAIQSLANHPAISRIKVDAVLQAPVAVLAAAGPAESNIVLVRAPDLWALGYDGDQVVVATMDTGVDINHQDIGPSWRGWDNLGNSWFDPHGEHPLTPSDADGHGTGVMGVIVGGNLGGNYIGVVPGAQWIAVKAWNDAGISRNSILHQGFQWILDPDGDEKTDDAPDIVNNSWGFELNPHECLEAPDPTSPGSDLDTDFHPDIMALKAAGIAVVFSAGNLGSNPMTDISPGNYPEAFSVGSVDTLDSQISLLSSRGPSACDNLTFPKVVAPGNPVFTSDITFNGTFPDSYAFWQGTSFAAPHVSGVMAQLMQAFPLAPLSDIEDAVLASAQDLGSLGPDNNYGYGLLDALAAYDWLIQAPDVAVADPVPPTNDLMLDFGEQLPAVASQQTIVVSNTGRGELQLGSIDFVGDASFSIDVDTCSNVVLTAGQNCNITVSFSSALEGSYSGTLTINTNDVDEGAVALTLAGSVADTATPSPRLVVTDSVAPTGDANLPFGTRIVGSGYTETFQVANADTGDLVLGTIDMTALDPAFSVVVDGCSNQTLAFNETCQVMVEFFPNTATIFSGLIALPSNDADSPHQVTVSGAGNTLPSAPTLISPDQGGLVESPVTFFWRQAPDVDGHKITNHLYVSEDPNFSGASPVHVAELPYGQKVVFAQIGGILFLVGLLLRREKTIYLLLILGLVFCGLGACSSSSGTDPNLRSYSVSLPAQTTYYWKVSADDGNGGVVESSVSYFLSE